MHYADDIYLCILRTKSLTIELAKDQAEKKQTINHSHSQSFPHIKYM